MKVFISADIEGVCGSTAWDETEKGNAEYGYYAKQMTLEVKAVCDGANQAGVDEITVNDAHNDARNIDHNLLPKNTKLVRGWSGGLYSMVQELDESYDALLFVGYHSAGSKTANPLSHTMSLILDNIKINGQVASEFLIHSYIAAYHGVPVVFLSGDKGLCEDVRDLNENIKTVEVKEGKGNSTINIHPQLAIDLIQKNVKAALTSDIEKCKIDLPDEFEVEIRYRQHKDAYRASYYPDVTQVDGNTVQFKTKDYMEVLRMFNYLV